MSSPLGPQPHLTPLLDMSELLMGDSAHGAQVRSGPLTPTLTLTLTLTLPLTLTLTLTLTLPLTLTPTPTLTLTLTLPLTLLPTRNP